jgi:hypothetical protein
VRNSRDGILPGTMGILAPQPMSSW